MFCFREYISSCTRNHHTSSLGPFKGGISREPLLSTFLGNAGQSIGPLFGISGLLCYLKCFVCAPTASPRLSFVMCFPCLVFWAIGTVWGGCMICSQLYSQDRCFFWAAKLTIPRHSAHCLTTSSIQRLRYPLGSSGVGCPSKTPALAAVK